MSSQPRRPLREGEWACVDAKCANINKEFHKQCTACAKKRPEQKSRLNREIGKDQAEKSKGLFNAEDWACTKCGNVNWARRNTCNMCNAPKVGELEKRTGYGGGYMERYDVEYIHREDNEEFDEFGRIKKKRKAGEEHKVGSTVEDSGDEEELGKYDFGSEADDEQEKENDDEEEEEEDVSSASVRDYFTITGSKRNGISINIVLSQEDEEDEDDLGKYDLTADPEVIEKKEVVEKIIAKVSSKEEPCESDCSCSCSGGECSCSEDEEEMKRIEREKERAKEKAILQESRSSKDRDREKKRSRSRDRGERSERERDRDRDRRDRDRKRSKERSEKKRSRSKEREKKKRSRSREYCNADCRSRDRKRERSRSRDRRDRDRDRRRSR
ncbi:hypothetical protein PENTCL1PPCAC_4414, partial [Pristionchus entomophagus]